MTPGRERDAFAQYTVRDEATARIAAAQWKSIRAWRHSRQGGTPRLRSACSGAPVRGIPHPLGNNSRGSQGCIFPDKSDPFRETQEEYYYRLTTAVPSLPETPRSGPRRTPRSGRSRRSQRTPASDHQPQSGRSTPLAPGGGRSDAGTPQSRNATSWAESVVRDWQQGRAMTPLPPPESARETRSERPPSVQRSTPRPSSRSAMTRSTTPAAQSPATTPFSKDPRGELGAGSWRWDDATSYTTVFHDRFLANPASSLGATTVAAMEPVYRTGASAAASSRPASSLGWTTATATTGGMESGASDASEYLPPRPKSCDPGTATRQMMPGGPVFGAASYDTTRGFYW
mmetsp:Transcript_1721/g.3812  ORF Transcript_1721/g.3812 Transcript_1721/m.3812 type:complete len:344 (-) Transcript_1721:164-1195(-)